METESVKLFERALDYRLGRGVTPDESRAFQYYKKSADLGNLDAINALGLCYWDGRGCSVDINRAMQLLNKAADLGFALSHYNLRIRYTSGQLIPQDFGKAHKHHLEAAKLGYGKAMYNLAINYIHGEGTEKDLYAATSWLEKAFEAGIEKAKAKREAVILLIGQQLVQIQPSVNSPEIEFKRMFDPVCHHCRESVGPNASFCPSCGESNPAVERRG